MEWRKLALKSEVVYWAELIEKFYQSRKSWLSPLDERAQESYKSLSLYRIKYGKLISSQLNIRSKYGLPALWKQDLVRQFISRNPRSTEKLSLILLKKSLRKATISLEISIYSVRETLKFSSFKCYHPKFVQMLKDMDYL